jgi:hypothetical protein
VDVDVVAFKRVRRCLLVAALGFTFVRPPDPPPTLVALHSWLDSWNGTGAVVTGMERQGYDVSLTRYPEGWRATFIRRDHTTRPWVGQVLSFHPTPWQAVQHAAWTVLDANREDTSELRKKKPETGNQLPAEVALNTQRC